MRSTPKLFPVFVVAIVLVSFIVSCGGGGGGGGGPILMVNTTDDVNDGSCSDSHCSLREAIIAANGMPEPAKIRFNIGGGGLQTIHPAAGLPTLVKPVTIDGTTQPGFVNQPVIVLDGSLFLSNIASDGLDIHGGSSTIKGLVIINFPGAGISIDLVGGNNITGCFIGVDASGLAAGPNTGDGIWIQGGDGNTIGGNSTVERNLISGNQGVGIRMASDNNLVIQNFIGTDYTGAVGLPNSGHGIMISGNNNTIGGIAGLAGNVISGNLGDGVSITGVRNAVQGNVIGLNIPGETAVGNHGNGVTINAELNIVGGTQMNQRNVISANWMNGVQVLASSVLVQGNYIGTDGSGSLALGNHLNGISVFGVGSIQIGGSDPFAKNIISGNQLAGVLVEAGSSGVSLFGNRIGTDATGMFDLGNVKAGIVLSGSDLVVGASFSGGRNLVSGNSGPGIAITPGSTAITIQNNLIGTDLSGAKAIGNGSGVEVGLGQGNTSVTIGGSSAGQGNVISGNTGYGLLLYTGATVQGNMIGTDESGLYMVSNGGDGILIKGPGNTIGGMGASNTIAYNGQNGVSVISESGLATANSILANSIHDNGGLGIAIAGQSVIPNDPLDLDIGDNNRQNYPLLVSAVSDPVAVNTTFSGSLDSAPGSVFTIEFFSNVACDPSGFGEGQRWVNSMQVTTTVNGLAQINLVIPSTVFDTANFITSTATDQAGNTSGFSNCIQVTEGGATPTPAPFYFTPDINAYCRSGPDPIFPSLEFAMKGTPYLIDGRNLENTWLYIMLSSQLGCWVSADTGKASADTGLVRILAAIPTPTFTPVPLNCGQYLTAATCSVHADVCIWNRKITPAVCQAK